MATTKKFKLVSLVKDAPSRHAVATSLRGDGRLSTKEVRGLLRQTTDDGEVTPQEFDDLKMILHIAKTIDDDSRRLIDKFLQKHKRPTIPQRAIPAGQLTANFNVAEFACKDGTAVPAHLMENVRSLAKNLQVLRDTLGKPIRINSSYRTVAHNKAIGGATNSQHLHAKAADIVVSGWKPGEVKKQIETLIKAQQMSEGASGIIRPSYTTTSAAPKRGGDLFARTRHVSPTLLTFAR